MKSNFLTSDANFILERLEDRIAPAGVFTYSDVDGDFVTIKSSKGTDIDLAAAITLAASGLGQQAQDIDLASNPAVFQGTSLTITAKRTSVGGDGFVNIGQISGSGVDLGAIKIHGDLGAVAAGDADTSTPAVKSLNLQSLGRLGTSTGAPLMGSSLAGALGSLIIKEDFNAALLLVAADDDVDGSVGKVSIGGSLIGGTALFENGSIYAEGNIGPVKIGGDIVGSSLAGSGSIHSSAGSIASLTVGGSLRGGNGIHTDGQIFGEVGIGSVKIGRGIEGGAGDRSGTIWTNGTLSAVIIGGSVAGGSGDRSGSIFGVDGISSVKIEEDLRGGTNILAGAISSNTSIGTVSIGGSMVGGSINGTGAISSLGSIGQIKVGGDIKGGGDSAGIIGATGVIGSTVIGGSIFGGSGNSSGVISAASVGTLKVEGSVIGGSGDFSGRITTFNNASAVNSIIIGGSVIGGSGNTTGGILIASDVGKLVIEDNLIGGSITGTASLSSSGFVQLSRHVGSIFIGGSIIAGVDDSSGSLTGNNAAIRIGEDAGSFKVGGSIVGNDTQAVRITAAGSDTPMGFKDLAFGSITIGGRVEHANILAGYDVIGTGIGGSGGVNADAQIGKVTVGGGWIQSNMTAGTNDGGDDVSSGNETALSGVGVTDVAERVSQIASIDIKGQILGTPTTAGDFFGFVAQEIKSFKVGMTTIPLTAGPSNNLVPRYVSPTLDVLVREIA